MVHVRPELGVVGSLSFALSLLLLTTSPSLSQSTEIGPSIQVRTRTAALRAAVDLVLVPVTVTDSLNHPQIDLSRDDFRLYENNQAQQIKYFSKEDSPVSVGILLDVSKSMTDKIEKERAALEEFFKNANPEDDYFVITFNDRLHVLSDTAGSIAGIQTELGLVEPSGSTAMLDAVYLGVSKLANARYSRHALVIISDGGDNSSRYKLREIKELVEESDVMVYAIGIFDFGPLKTFEEVMGKKWLGTITDVTGGRTIPVEDLTRLPDTAAALSRELRSQYVLGYEPSDKHLDGKWHKIKVVLARSGKGGPLHSYNKRGYYYSSSQ